ncbi:MAG: translocation/assembly module TamB domain-containing protein [Flavobacteriales bacterium]
MLLPPALLGLIALLIYFPPVQDRIRKEAVGYLEKKIGTRVSLDHFALRYPIGVSVDGLLVFDESGDTLLYAGELKSSLGLGALIDGRIELNGTQLSHVRAHLVQRADSTFNFTYIIRAFAPDTAAVKEAVADSTAPMPFSASGVDLTDVRFDMELARSGFAMHVVLGELQVEMDAMDAGATLFHARSIHIANTRVDMSTTPSPSEPDTYPALTNPLEGLDIDLRELGFQNVAFTLTDAVSHDSLWVQVGTGALQVDSLVFARQQMRFASVALTDAHFGTLAKDTLVQGGLTSAPPPWLDQHDGFRYWARGLDIAVHELVIDGGNIQMHQGAIRPARELMDPDHMDYRAITLRAENLAFNDRTVTAFIRDLKATGTGDAVLHASVNVDAIPSLVRLSDGIVALGITEVRFAATAAPGDMTNVYRAPKAVPLNVRVSSSIDLAQLQELLDQFGVVLPQPIRANEVWNMQVGFSGTAQRVDTLRLDIVGDQGTVVHMDGDAQDLGNIVHSPFRADVREVVMGDGMRSIVASYMPANTPKPSRMAGSVRVVGTGAGMVGYLDLRSDLGDVKGSVGATGLHDSMPDAVKADLTIQNVPLDRFTGDTTMGLVSAKIVGEGKALKTSDRRGNLEVIPSQLLYHGQDLSGSRIAAKVQGDSIHAEVTTDAPALAIALRADARWPVGSDTISGAVALRADRLQLKAMGWYDHPLDVQGQWNGTARFSTDGFTEFALVGDSVQLSNPERSFRFEEFTAQGRLSTDSTFLVLSTDALEVDYSTNIPVDSLLPHTREKLLSFFREDSSFVPGPGRRMDLRVALPKTEWLTGIVLPDLKAIELEEFTGHYDSDTDALRLTIDVPVLQYQDIALTALTVNANAKGKALDGALRLDSIRYKDFHVHGFALTANSRPGTLKSALRIDQEDGVPKYVVPIDFRRTNGDIAMHLAEGLVLDTSAWTVDPLNELRFTDAGPEAQHFVLSSGDQRAELVTNTNSTEVHLDQFNMGALLNLVSTRDSMPIIGGAMSGEVVLPLNASSAMRADLRVEDLQVTGKPIGDLAVHAEGPGSAQYTVNARLENGTNELDADARYDSEQQPPAMEAHARIGLTDMAFLQPFAGGVLYELGGGLKGTVDWRKLKTGNSVQGDLTFTNAFVGVKRTGARYELRNERLLADADGFTFNDFTVLDSLGNAFVLHGQVFTTDLSSMRFDLDLHTDSFQLVNSAPAKDELFYGDLIAALDVRVTGTDKAPVVKGDLGILAGTDLSVVLPGSQVKLVESEGIVEFTTDLSGTDTTRVATAEERMRDSLRAQLPKVDLDLNIRVDDRAAFAIVLDPTTGDQATFKGTGDLRFQYDPDGQMRLTGPFVVSEGGYTLEFYGLVKKRFDLLPGSSVTWSGDPIDARMDIRARYVSESAAYPLVANATGTLSEAERNRLSARLPFEVVISIDGAMKKPDIGFGIDLPREYRNSYPQVNDELDRLADRSQEEELNRQVFGLLVLNSFVQDEGAGGAPSSTIATSAARNSVNGILTDQMNKVTGRYVKGVDIQLGVSTVDQAQGNSTYQRTSVDYKVSKSFLDKRLSFEVGGSVGVDENEASASNVNNTRAAQYAIIYNLTRDGRFRLRGYYENAFDLYDGEITDSGIALIHTRDFEENERAREAAREAHRKQEAEERKKKKADPENDGPAAPQDPAGP